jgi:subtilisin family serine protease
VFSADSIGGLLGGSIQHHQEAPQLVHHASPDADFWIDSWSERDLDTLVGDVRQTLSSAHNSSGLTSVRNDYGFTGAGQTVAVIDSGIAWNHTGLGNGFGSNYRVVGGWDFTENDSNPYDDGPWGSHGTHVAGIVGADTTGTSNDGVAPGVDLVGLRVFDDSGAGYFSWVESALDWVHQNRNAFENPITAVNLSLGTSWNSSSITSFAMLEDEFAQLKADGIFIAVSAGNSFGSYNTPGLSYPAASPHVVPVMSVTDSGSLSTFSQRHTRAIGAPGQYIVSTVPDYVGDNNGVNDDYASFSGTSMASPYVAGASVLIRQAMQFVGYTNITQDTIYNHMMNTATSFFDSATGQTYKRLNLTSAFNALMPTDEYGSTSATAHGLGTLNGSAQMIGAIGKLNDVDYFQFTAAVTGTVTFQISTSHSLTPTWSGAGGAASGNTYSFQVVAGQSYTVGLATSGGIGWYGITVTSAGAPAANSPPVLATIGNRTVNEGSLLNFTASATDANSGQSLTYSLGSGAPAGATINPITGAFSWTPTAAQGPATYNVTVVVTDNGAPALSDSETFTITVIDVTQTPATEYIRFLSTTSSNWLWAGNNNWVYTTSADIVKLTMTETTYAYSMCFNGTDVGLTTTSEGVDAFTFLADGSILVSTVGAFSVSNTYSAPGYGSGGVITGGGEDILRFTPSTVGDNTMGTWSIYLDGSDVGLSGSGENIDSVSVLPDGRLVISTFGKANVPGVSAADEDLMVFAPSYLGSNTWGTWSMYFDGSDVGLTTADEDVDAVFVSQGSGAPDIFISTRGNFAVAGNAGANEDVFAFRPNQLGSSTWGSFMPYLVFDGSYYGLPHLDVDGFYFGPAPANTALGSLAFESAADAGHGDYLAAFSELAALSHRETLGGAADTHIARIFGSSSALTTTIQRATPHNSIPRHEAEAAVPVTCTTDMTNHSENHHVDPFEAWSSVSSEFDEIDPWLSHGHESGGLHAIDYLFSLTGRMT